MWMHFAIVVDKKIDYGFKVFFIKNQQPHKKQK